MQRASRVRHVVVVERSRLAGGDANAVFAIRGARVTHENGQTRIYGGTQLLWGRLPRSSLDVYPTLPVPRGKVFFGTFALAVA